MPFPLAHPAAVLPLRRFCPRHLSLGALVAGSLAPDLSYAFARFDLDRVAHRWQGGFLLDLPAGLILWFLTRAAVRFAVTRLPSARLTSLTRAARTSGVSSVSLTASVLIGVWLHLAWDAFTHNDGWMVVQSSSLRHPVLSVGSRTVRVCHLLWYASTVGGVYALGQACHRAALGATPGNARPATAAKSRPAMFLAAATLPVASLHHLLRGRAGQIVVALATLLVVASFAAFLAARVWPKPRPPGPGELRP